VSISTFWHLHRCLRWGSAGKVDVSGGMMRLIAERTPTSRNRTRRPKLRVEPPRGVGGEFARSIESHVVLVSKPALHCIFAVPVAGSSV
jgi:hypothetical protein